MTPDRRPRGARPHVVALGAFATSVAALAGCASEPARGRPRPEGAASVTSATVGGDEPKGRSDRAAPGAGASRSSAPAPARARGPGSPAVTPAGERKRSSAFAGSEPDGSPAEGEDRGPETEDARTRRERVISGAADEDRPPGGAEARVEPDGWGYQRGVGFLPHYSLRTVDRRDSRPTGLERLAPGTPVELPPPAPEEPARGKVGAVERVDQPTPSLVPRPVGGP